MVNKVENTTIETIKDLLMKLKHLIEMEWNENDIEIAKNAKSEMEKVSKQHDKLVSELNPKRKTILKKLKEIESQESGQGQRGDEVLELKTELKDIDDKINKSQTEVDRLTRVYTEIVKMRKN